MAARHQIYIYKRSNTCSCHYENTFHDEDHTVPSAFQLQFDWWSESYMQGSHTSGTLYSNCTFGIFGAYQTIKNLGILFNVQFGEKTQALIDQMF